MNSAVALIPDDTVEQRVLGIVHVHCLSTARLAQSVERKALNLVVVGSSPTVGVFHVRIALMALPRGTGSPISLLAGGRSMWNAR